MENALRRYKGDSSTINNLLLNDFDPNKVSDSCNPSLKLFANIINALDAKIKKSVFKTNQNQLLYRGMNVDIFNGKPTNEVTLKAFTSTTSELEIAKQFAGINGYIYVICSVANEIKALEVPQSVNQYNAKGNLIGSEISNENEILFQRNIIMKKIENCDIIKRAQPNPGPYTFQYVVLIQQSRNTLENTPSSPASTQSCQSFDVSQNVSEEDVYLMCDILNDSDISVEELYSQLKDEYKQDIDKSGLNKGEFCSKLRQYAASYKEKQIAGQPNKVLLLSRWRAVHMKGKRKYVNIKGELVPLTQAKKMDKSLKSKSK